MPINKIDQLINSRVFKRVEDPLQILRKSEGEGGCGVIGLACEDKIAGKHLLPGLYQMRNRGNGKGGGIAACGLSASQLGVSQEVLDHDYLLAVAYLDFSCQIDLEHNNIYSIFEVDHIHQMPRIDDFHSIDGLMILPAEVILYFVRVKQEFIEDFRKERQISQDTPKDEIEDEIVYQNSYNLNCKYYASDGEKKAFVLSHGKNLLILKLVGYGDDVIRYYCLEEFKAHVWIGHHRYPTKGRVWHPGGAHPFIGMHQALVHNGDFANYFSICEYLSQRNIHPHFLTDTEVAVLIFDLLFRIYRYPLEYVIEALAPTTERDFFLLPWDKQSIYRLIQKTHIHGSPDGPWFFLIAQSLMSKMKPLYRLIGITDTSMLRPQVFALQRGSSAIGLAASEKQAIDATLQSLSKDDERFWESADYYWNARGGSYQDGGAFSFTVYPNSDGGSKLIATDKFENPIYEENLKPFFYKKPWNQQFRKEDFPDFNSPELFSWVKTKLSEWDYEKIWNFLMSLNQRAESDFNCRRAIEINTLLLDQHYSTGSLRKSCLISLLNNSLKLLFDSIANKKITGYPAINVANRKIDFLNPYHVLIIDAKGFPSEGQDSLAATIIEMFKKGFKRQIIYNCSGQRFIGNGLGENSKGVRIDIYGSSGDYLGSGIDGAEIHVHGFAQDQLAQIMKTGRIIIYGDVGQTFMYGAKGGCAFVLGNAAGRPLINAVGKPRAVINGTCLDYLAESFMAGNPLQGGGFAIVNGLCFNQEGDIIDLDNPYPGNNLFSLASGGAIYLRDPGKIVNESQLNGGKIVELSEEDWELILPYLEQNAHIFEIPISRLLNWEGVSIGYKQAYRKICPSRVRVLQEEEAWVKGKD